MSDVNRRNWYWTFIFLVLVISALLAYVRYMNDVRKIENRVEKGLTQAGEEKAPLIRLGLDLAGGVDLLYQAEPAPSSKEQTVTKQQMSGLIETVRRRVDPEGVKEVSVQQIGVDRLNIQIPGESDPERTKELIGKTALLQFIDAGDVGWSEGDKVIVLAEGEEPPTPAEATDTGGVDSADETTSDESAASEEPEKEKPHETHYINKNKVILEGSMLKTATLTVGNDGGYVVQITWNRQGARIFADWTARNVGKFLAIILDDQVISCPVIKSAIPAHSPGVIEGRFTAQGAQDLATLLQSGALPIPLSVLSSRAIGPTLGQESIDFSLRAGMIGLLLVIVFMMVYYRFLGFMADLSLLYYSLIFLLIASMGITLTLPGIAGFILSIGMAVDANVIIFERIKEELNSGKTYKAAIDAGFERAFPAIMDSNVTTLITGLVLMMMGSGTIKGFATTLSLGIVISMFSAMLLTRNLIALWSGYPALQKPGLFGWKVRPGSKAS